MPHVQGYHYRLRILRPEDEQRAHVLNTTLTLWHGMVCRIPERRWRAAPATGGRMRFQAHYDVDVP